MPARRLPGCTSCRKRHLRCDRAKPSCSNCQNAKTPTRCTFGGLKIRLSHYSTGPPDEEEDDGSTCQATTAEPLARSPAPSRNPEVLPDAGHPSDPASLRQRPTWSPVESSPAGLSPGAPFEAPFSTRRDSSGQDRDGSCATTAHQGGTSHRLQNTRSIVHGSLEQDVFGFYISHAGPWLDVASSDRHFGDTIPRLALLHPVLYSACLSYAANVMRLWGQLTTDVYERFHGESIAALIPMLSPSLPAPGEDGDSSSCSPGSPRLLHEVLYATTVILRMSEQFSELAEDGLYHLYGAHSIFAMESGSVGRKCGWSPASLDLKGVAFWTYIRESIRVCFLYEQGLSFDLDRLEDRIPAVGAPEAAWTNYMTYLVARLCDACWGGGADSGGSRGQAARLTVRDRLEEWRAKVPESFQPWCFVPDEGATFPTVRYLSPWHELAWQQYYTCKIMIAVYSREGAAGQTMQGLAQYMNAEILEPARLLCSICFSSSSVGCQINGAHLISWCGQFFNSREEQRRLAGYLRRFMDEVKWPNQTCFDRLQRLWAGECSGWLGDT